MPRRFAPRRAPRAVAAPATLLVLAGCALGVSIAVALDPVPIESRVVERPIEVADDGFVSSDTCRSCHPGEYASWHASFHRTMTQVATPETVRADFDGVVVTETAGAPMRLERRGDEFWAAFDDPGWEGPSAERPRITRRVVMITGSHHQNIYWYATGHDRALNVLPAVYLLDEARWVPRSAVVLHPPGQGVATTDGHWNAICIACHTTRGRTGFDPPFGTAPIAAQSVDTTVAELGIACESCHGPADEHVRANRNPLRRYARYADDDGADPTIVQPARLDPAREAEVCGQCHGIWTFHDAAGERAADARGLPYRPGDVLRETRFVAQPRVNGNAAHMRALLAADPEFVRGSFWPDGQVRVSGREYNGLLDSPCFAEATEPARTMTCLTCHAMHRTPDDPRPAEVWADTHQIAADREGDGGCVGCHAPIAADVPAHTKHDADSAGSRCYNCHMPYTSYGLLRAIRSHTVSSPSVQESVEVGRPNACNLCHLDQTLSWTGDWLRAWYGMPPPALDVTERAVAASVLWVLRGDAGMRALTAWHMGWEPAREASGSSWMVPYLGELLGDSYDAVRYVAAASLRRLPGLEGLDYDYVAPAAVRREAAVDVLRAWRSSPAATERSDARLLYAPDGALDTAAMRRLFDARDRRPLFLRE